MTTSKRTYLLAAALFTSYHTPLIAEEVSPSASSHAQLDPAQEIHVLKGELARLLARVESLETELDATKAQANAAIAAANQTAQAAVDASTAAAAAEERAQTALAATEAAPSVTFKAAPELKGAGGWTFKPRGRANLDVGFVSAPESTGADSGFDAEARRIRLGVSGDIPGGFGYKIEADFAENEVALTDAIITYEDGDWTITAGQHNNFQGLEEISSSLNTSFIERAAFTDAFGFERRVGLSAQYKAGDLAIWGGVFADNSEDLPNNNWSVDGRIVYAPKVGSTQLHFGGSFHQNNLGSGSEIRYRQRPLVHFTDNRFVNTGRFSADKETGIGLEAAAIHGPFHIALEGYSQMVDRPGLLADPNFFGGSAEVGIFLTKGDSRGYKIGKFDRVKPKNPVGKGGIGAVQANLRFDHLDLTDAGIVGGTQDSFQASLIWTFNNYSRLLLNYALLSYDDAAFPTATGDTSYDVNVMGLRAQVDF